MDDVTVRFDERAERDAEATVEWYEQQQPGLGAEFIDTLEETIVGLTEHPRMYPEVEPDIRRALTGKFPYSIYYQLYDNEIVILAVLHTRRAPDVLKGRTEE